MPYPRCTFGSLGAEFCQPHKFHPEGATFTTLLCTAQCHLLPNVSAQSLAQDGAKGAYVSGILALYSQH